MKSLKLDTALLVCSLLARAPVYAQEQRSGIEINGFIMTDAGYNFNTIDPDWFDVMRPSKLPATSGAFGPDGNVFLGIRQTRLGVQTWTHTTLGEMKT
jgi:hypothetical protein